MLRAGSKLTSNQYCMPVLGLLFLRYAYSRFKDDFKSEFSLSRKPEETIYTLTSHDNVIYMNSFLKSISPSLHVAYMVLPKKLVEVYDKKVGFYACTVPTFEQLVIHELIQNCDFERHLNRIRRKKRKEMR